LESDRNWGKIRKIAGVTTNGGGGHAKPNKRPKRGTECECNRKGEALKECQNETESEKERKREKKQWNRDRGRDGKRVGHQEQSTQSDREQEKIKGNHW
jgi:hypothetical protein